MCGVAVRDVTSERVNYMYSPSKKKWRVQARKFCGVLPQNVRTRIVSNCFFFFNASTCPCGLRGSPSWAWQECNRLLRLGRS